MLNRDSPSSADSQTACCFTFCFVCQRTRLLMSQNKNRSYKCSRQIMKISQVACSWLHRASRNLQHHSRDANIMSSDRRFSASSVDGSTFVKRGEEATGLHRLHPELHSGFSPCVRSFYLASILDHHVQTDLGSGYTRRLGQAQTRQRTPPSPKVQIYMHMLPVYIDRIGNLHAGRVL